MEERKERHDDLLGARRHFDRWSSSLVFKAPYLATVSRQLGRDNMMREAGLLIIDMQAGNFSGTNPIFNGEELLSKVKHLVEKARSAHASVTFIQNDGGVGDPDQYGTPGWEIHSALAPLASDVLIRKKTPDAFHQTSLHTQLESRGIKRLVVAGLQTEYCIDTTCRRAFSLGYEVTLVRDAHSTWDSSLLSAQQIIDHHNMVLGGFFVSLENEAQIEF